MIGYSEQLTAVIFLLYAVTLPGEAQNYQQRLTDTGYYPKQPAVRSYSSPQTEPVQYDNRGLPSSSYTRSSSYIPYHYHHQHGYNYNYPVNQRGPRWDYNTNSPPRTPSNNHFTNYYSGNKFFTERPYPYGFPDLYTDRFNTYISKDKNTGQKVTTEVTVVSEPVQLTKRNSFNISLVPVQQTRNTSKRKSDDYDSRHMVYPTEAMSPFVKPLNSNNPSKNCSFGLCDIIDDYPAEKIKRIIGRSIELQQYFANVIDESESVSLNNRFGADFESLCPTMKHTQFPKTAVNTDKIERYLVNVGDYKQGIVYETCESANGPCAFAETFPESYNAVCVQKYTIRRLMTVSKESEQAIFDNFQLPSCCVCSVYQEKT